MILQEDAIVDIPLNRVRYFGCTGKMLLPCPATIAALIQKLPTSKLITTDLLRQYLKEQFEVEGVCPVTTKKSLQAVAHDTSDNVAYWRVLKKNGELFSFFPGGAEGQAALLRKEGYTVNTEGKAPKVNNFAESLVRF
jgi:hypothetical protein